MKTRTLLLAILFLVALHLQGQHQKSKFTPAKSEPSHIEYESNRGYKFKFTNSFLQLFHPYTPVFSVGMEGHASNGLAFYVEYGVPIKSFGNSATDRGKLDWTYYKTRLGARYYFEPTKPYKKRRRYGEPQLKNYLNYFGIEGMVGAETFDRENSYYYEGNQIVSYSHAKVVMLSRGLLMTYGRQFAVTDRFILGVSFGIGQRTINVAHESLILDGSFGGFGFFQIFQSREFTEGVTKVPHLKIGLELGLRTFKRK
jgi:hypothetical protein